MRVSATKKWLAPSSRSRIASACSRACCAFASSPWDSAKPAEVVRHTAPSGVSKEFVCANNSNAWPTSFSAPLGSALFCAKSAMRHTNPGRPGSTVCADTAAANTSRASARIALGIETYFSGIWEQIKRLGMQSVRGVHVPARGRILLVPLRRNFIGSQTHDSQRHRAIYHCHIVVVNLIPAIAHLVIVGKLVRDA